MIELDTITIEYSFSQVKHLLKTANGNMDKLRDFAVAALCLFVKRSSFTKVPQHTRIQMLSNKKPVKDIMKFWPHQPLKSSRCKKKREQW